jgi:DNA replication and repair protein RecF
MWVQHLSLRNFRNYVRLELDLPKGLVVLFGDNGQGKTNLLEALYLLATSRSPRTVSDREMIHWQAGEPPVARVAAQVVRRSEPGRPLNLAIALQAKPAPTGATSGAPQPGALVEKHIRINGAARRALDLIGQLAAVLFRARDVELADGPPALRRRYLDGLLALAEQRYLRALQRYQRVLLQRNHLLRRLRERQARQEELTFWDHELINLGSYLIARRLSALAFLQQEARALYARFTQSREALEVAYEATVPEASTEEATVRERFREALAAARSRETELAQSLVGPHRDDLRLSIGGADLNLYGSRGQQRSATLALRFAQARYLAYVTGEAPVLLLDDALAELDVHRRSALLDLAAEFEQCFLTTTDEERAAEARARGATVYRIEAGRLTLG